MHDLRTPFAVLALVAGCLAVQPLTPATAAGAAPSVVALSVDPSAVQPGGSSQGTVTLDMPAVTGGTTVTLTSDHAGVQVPGVVLVEEQRTSASFPVTTDVGTSGNAEITAAIGSASRSAELVVADTVAPETTITRTVVRDRKRGFRVRVRFTASEPGSTFLCRLDYGAYKPCVSPHVYRRVLAGRHLVWVQAIDAHGNADHTPALDEFHVRR